MSGMVFGPVLLAAFALLGFSHLFLAVKHAPLSASQRRTGYMFIGAFLLGSIVWLVIELVTLLYTPDPADHITATTAALILDVHGRAGLAYITAGIAHLLAHLWWRGYPFWPSVRPGRQKEGR